MTTRASLRRPRLGFASGSSIIATCTSSSVIERRRRRSVVGSEHDPKTYAPPNHREPPTAFRNRQLAAQPWWRDPLFVPIDAFAPSRWLSDRGGAISGYLIGRCRLARSVALELGGAMASVGRKNRWALVRNCAVRTRWSAPWLIVSIGVNHRDRAVIRDAASSRGRNRRRAGARHRWQRHTVRASSRETRTLIISEPRVYPLSIWSYQPCAHNITFFALARPRLQR